MAKYMNMALPYPWQLDQYEKLVQQSKMGRIPHAVLVQGEQTIGKRQWVNALLQKLLCIENQEFACGECKSCQLIQAGTHPDFVNVGLEEKSKQIKVEQIRGVIDFVGKTPQMGGMKIVVIEPAEQLNLNSANALLKCLEEPAGHTLIILISHAPGRLLPTIRSRCQSIMMYKPALPEADKWLSAYIADEKTRVALLTLASNNPLLAMDYADKEMPAIYSAAIKQLAALQHGSESLIRQAEQVDKLVDGNILVWLSIQQKIIWQLLQNSLQVPDAMMQELTILDSLSKKPAFQKRAYKMLDEIQQAIAEVQGVSNPNILLLIESLLIRWQALLRA